jgi:hypothetical protein
VRFEQPVRCGKCYLRIEPYELRTVYYKTTYHQHCFLLLVREEANRRKASQEETGLAEAAQEKR